MIVNLRYCQLSNRIVLIAHALATAWERGSALRITELDDLKDSYACAVPPGRRVVVRGSLFWRIEKRIYGALRRLAGGRPLGVGMGRLGVVTDWRFRNNVAVERFHDEIVAFFRPKPEVIAYARHFEKRLLDARAQGAVVVGVHVRRGDYRTWKNGMYFYTDEIYRGAMACLQEELNRRVLFVIFSNEDVSLESFRGMDVVKSGGSPYDDHYLMSRCDYLMGPPSTFTLWASFVGKVPLSHIREASHRPKLVEFAWNRIC